MFVDEVRIHARAGHGGRGCVAFLREAFRPKGGPIGGDGGRGGSVILRADHDLGDLVNQYYSPHIRAENGAHGLGKGMNGKAGRDQLIKVPCGTLVWRLHRHVPASPAPEEPPPEPPPAADAPEPDADPESVAAPPAPADVPGAQWRMRGSARGVEVDLADLAGEPKRGVQWRRGELVADLTEHGQEIVLCRGGRGGLGNRHFATARRQAPRFAQPGEPGEEGDFLLELRLIADVGLVGYPNAGKSTLLAAISRARPKVAAYPFTTLHPQVGVVEYDDWQRLTVCDVPGLIEGAHRDVGLGHAFLRHIRRCQALAFVLDIAGSDGRKPWDDYEQLLKELELYDAELLERPRLLVANKMDEPDAGENLRLFRQRFPDTLILPLAAAFDEGIEAFRAALRQLAVATPRTP
jgi:GTP-binding protein